MTPENIAAIADAYERAEHTPKHPSYTAFVAETLEQYRTMTDAGIWIIPTPGSQVAYESSEDMFRDLDRYNRLVVATDGSPFASGHPLNEYYVPHKNTAFRAVHDYFGHYLGRFQFETFDGELNAYRAHKARYSPAAHAALFSETVAQLCYFYARGEFVPVQKACILPVTI